MPAQLPRAPLFACMSSDNPDEGIAACTAIIQSESESPGNRARAFDSRGKLYAVRKGDNDRAIVDYDEAIKLNPDFFNAWYDRGNAYHAKGDYDRAIQDYDEAIKRFAPLIPLLGVEVFNDRGKAYSMKGDHYRAIEDYDEAIKLNPNYAPAIYNRGIARRALGDVSGGDADITRAKQIAPNIGQ
jgi:tetratricopeptide (TPR) repeat protein